MNPMSNNSSYKDLNKTTNSDIKSDDENLETPSYSPTKTCEWIFTLRQSLWKGCL